MIGYAMGTGASEPPKNTPFPFERRKQSAYAYVSARGDHIIVDFGTNPFEHITAPPAAAFITHWHSDHTAGLHSARWFPTGFKLYAPRKGEWISKEPKNVEPVFIEPFKTIRIKSFSVTPLPLNHGIETYGYLIEADGSRIAHLTDTRGLPLDTLEYLFENTPDRIVLDATFITVDCCGKTWCTDKGRGHNGTKEILAIAENFPAAEIHLTHIPPYAPLSWVITAAFPRFKVLSDGGTF